MPGIPNHGEVWMIDFGMIAKVRPALILGCDIADEDRMLVTALYHTTSVRGSRWEIPMNVRGLDEGAFDVQSIYSVPVSKLIRRRAVVSDTQLHEIESRVKEWLELP